MPDADAQSRSGFRGTISLFELIQPRENTSGSSTVSSMCSVSADMLDSPFYRHAQERPRERAQVRSTYVAVRECAALREVWHPPSDFRRSTNTDAASSRCGEGSSLQPVPRSLGDAHAEVFMSNLPRIGLHDRHGRAKDAVCWRFPATADAVPTAHTPLAPSREWRKVNQPLDRLSPPRRGPRHRQAGNSGQGDAIWQ